MHTKTLQVKRVRNLVSNLFALASVLAVTSDARAFTRPHGREVTGIVRSVDPVTHMLTITIDCTNNDKEGLEVEWGSLTRAVLNGKRVTFEKLQVGTRVRIRYVSPIFGPKVLRSINWEDSPKEAQKEICSWTDS